uniref:global nitrogen transcriptional regulator n=1 Tax=Sahlingia subintegra TaxID=468936 RepID=UPI001FCDFA70|nr:global nitrogen transcriptional regulator [Sahlingia subintegra]UNJ17349.1 global nitrogen transcriptional regulator [Sahlingia subintegra]
MPPIIPEVHDNWRKRLLNSSINFEFLTLKQGDTIYLTDSPFILINVKGILSSIKKYSFEKSLIFALSTSNTLLHYKTNKSICYHKVQALTISYILVINNNLVDNTVKNQIFMIEIDTLKRQFSYLDHLVLLFIQNTIKKRLVVFFLTLAKQVGIVSEFGIIIKLSLSHLYIAEALGTTRVTVTRSLKALRKDFIIIEKKKIIIVNPIALADCVLRN